VLWSLQSDYNPFRPTEQERATKTRGLVTTASINQKTIKAAKNARARARACVCVCVCVLRPLQCHGPCSADHETWKWTKTWTNRRKFPREVDRTLRFPRYQNGSLLILRDARKPPVVKPGQRVSSIKQKPSVSKIRRFSTGSQWEYPKASVIHLASSHVRVFFSSWPQSSGRPFQRWWWWWWWWCRFEHCVNFYVTIPRHNLLRWQSLNTSK